MKKYFMKATNEELKFGDMIELDCSKDMEDGHTCHHHLECKFIPELVETLLEEDIISVEDDGNEPIDFDDIDPQIEIIIKDINNLVDNYKSLEEKVDMLHSDLNQIKNFLVLNCKKPSTNAKKPAGK